MSRKVYCKNCRYFYEYKGCKVFSPKNPSFTEKYFDHKGKKKDGWKNKKRALKICEKHKISVDNYDMQNIKCCNLNLKYNCKFYKRKWWKFWIRKSK